MSGEGEQVVVLHEINKGDKQCELQLESYLS